MSVFQRYLSLLGIGTRPGPSLQNLHQLTHAHHRSIPFENLSKRAMAAQACLPRRRSVEAFVEDAERRACGGVCQELNGNFAKLLVHLGYGVEFLSACVRPGRPSHVVLLVRPNDVSESYLVDVGFTIPPAEPVSTSTDRQTLQQHGGHFRFVRHGDLMETKFWHAAGVRAGYTVDMRPVSASFRDYWWYRSFDASSPFIATQCYCWTTGDRRIILEPQRVLQIGPGEALDEPRPESWPQDAFRAHGFDFTPIVQAWAS